MDKNISNLIRIGDVDGESLPLIRCVCGIEFPEWTFILGIYRDNAHQCPHCGRQMYFRNNIKVYEIGKEETV